MHDAIWPVLQMREKNLQPEHAAQLAQHIASGRIRVSELGGLASLGSQEHMVQHLQYVCMPTRKSCVRVHTGLFILQPVLI